MLFRTFCLCFVASLTACSSSTSDGAGGGGGGPGQGGGACIVAPRAQSSLPHATAAGDAATAVARALDAIVAAQTPAVAKATLSYTSTKLDCGDLSTPEPDSNGFGCTFDLAVDGAPPIAVTTPRPSALAKDLYGALAGAGAKECNDFAHGDFIHAANVKVVIGAATIDLDDASSYSPPTEPNVVVDAASAAPVLDAMTSAQIADCDTSARVFFVCTAMSGPPTCSYTRESLEDIGGSRLLYTCLPKGNTSPPTKLDAARSKAVWDALLGAAGTAGYKPLNGTLQQTTVVNARWFQFDGTKLGFDLTADDATPPGPSAGP